MDMTQAPDLQSDALLRDRLYQAGVTQRLSRPGVTEVAINRPGEIWTDSAEGWQREEAPYLTEETCRALYTAMGAYTWRPLTSDTPIQTLELPDGERALVVVPPACEKGTCSITIRKPSLDRFALDDYIQGGRFSLARAVATSTVELADWQIEMEMAHANQCWGAFFKLAIQHRQNIIIFGGPGSGKTTFAKALIDLFPAERRMITIEEINELQLPLHPNHIHLLYGGKVRPKELVAATLRMKPDHLFLAELTGDEAWHFMEILNTGNPGTVTTAHANDSLAGFARIAGLIKQSVVGQGLEMDYIQREVRTSFDVVVYMERKQILEVHYEPEVKLALLNGKSGRSS
ncbi:Type IV secretion system protein VirB11 [compost metagenome]